MGLIIIIIMYWPMPTMEDIFDTVADRSPSIFSNLDLKHAYFQVKLTDDSKPKTALPLLERIINTVEW